MLPHTYYHQLDYTVNCLRQGSATPGTRATGGTREDFCGTPSDLTRMRNLPYKRARRTPKLKLSTLHEINSPKICQACNSLDNFYVGDVCCGSANDTHNWFAVKAKKLAQDNPVYAISH